MDESQSKQNLVDIKQKIAKNQQKAQELQAERAEEALQIPPGSISNFLSIPTEKGEKHIPVPINDIVTAIKSEKDIIKILESYYLKKDGKILALADCDDLFSAVQELGKFVFFKQSIGYASKKEVFSVLLRKPWDFVRILHNPSYPRKDDIYYDCEYIEPEKTGALDEMVAFFNPKTEYDKSILKALFVTPAWSNSNGKKPIFLIQSDPDLQTPEEKCNVGKSTLAHKVGELYGGYIELTPAKQEEKVSQHVVKMAQKQVILFDNVKTTAWSNAQLESMVTAPKIQGHLMYHGQVEIDNHFTYIITVNDPSVSPDLASRAVPIVLCKAQNPDPRWDQKVSDFIINNRKKLFADIGHYIMQGAVERETATRFPVWEEVVLNKFIQENSDVKTHIKVAQKKVNFETDTGFQDYLIDQMNEYTVGYHRVERMVDTFDPEELSWWFSSNILQRMYQEFSGQKNSRMGRHLVQRVKNELSKLTTWTVSEYRPYINAAKQPRGYLLLKKAADHSQKVYAPYDIPSIDRQLRTFKL